MGLDDIVLMAILIYMPSIWEFEFSSRAVFITGKILTLSFDSFLMVMLVLNYGFY